MSEPFSHELRILTCGGCMAPIETAITGGAITCEFCGASNQFSARDESADLAAAKAAVHAAVSESERHARLRAQDNQPAPIPESIAALMREGQLAPANMPQAEADWRQSRADLALSASFPVCERFFHLTLLLAPLVEERRRRAMLETALELLPDEGHRHVLRCMLATAAARAVDFAAAEAWLAPVNSKPMDLTMDTAYRLAAASLAAARRQYEEVTQLLGVRPDDVPLANSEEISCSVLRIDALEHLGRGAEAVAELAAWIEKWGAERVKLALDRHLPLQLCHDSFAKAHIKLELDKQGPIVAGLERELERLAASFRWKANLGGVALGTALFALVIASVWVFTVSFWLEKDPLFGLHARVACPAICSGCSGPYRFVSWKTKTRRAGRDKTAIDVCIYCRDAAGRVAAASDAELVKAAKDRAPWLEAQELNGGVWALWFTMLFVFAPFIALYLLFDIIQGRRKKRAARGPLQVRLDAARTKRAELERELGGEPTR